ncbi:MAG: gamma carbonic anhydrase family protein [Oscillospiraceae bacterium]|nr:gamma carbonic anhydrase family protein [Oscillospiraceae bacterium]
MIVTFQGKTPQISSEAFVAETAVLIGDVTIGPDSSVWYGAVIRGDCSPITVGRGVSIQDNAVLHTEPGHPLAIGDNVTIGHGAIIHCASVGSNTLIGMGAILLDGAVIGDHCIIGAGAVVKEKTVAASGTMMVGVPAKCVRELGPEQLAFLDGTPPYVALSKAYLEGRQVKGEA